DGVMIITRNGVVNRQRVEEIRVIGRATQGVRLVNLDKKDQVMDVARVIADDADESEEMEAVEGVEPSTSGGADESPTGEYSPTGEDEESVGEEGDDEALEEPTGE
ncbi:MAG: DNA gyrase subunit A, partial [Gemmatimonadetes bacterium]|nr:DNA gyrase subunit A [Gemmatimonadota bacterium]